MKSKARDYKRTTIRRLDTLSGNECAAPDCKRRLIARDGESIVSKICHIEAASDEGPRFNIDMNDDERRHYNNLILLCDECHVIIDNKQNEKEYPVSLLRDWKTEHEAKHRSSMNAQTSLLKMAIDALASLEVFEPADDEQHDLTVFIIDQKINFNRITRNKFLIDEHKIYYTKIATLYEELESQGSFKKEMLLKNIRNIYLRTKGKYVGQSTNVLKVIQDNSDNIFEDIEEQLLKSCEQYSKTPSENILSGISIIMVDAFMRCKILEAPS